jgi:2-succinyl-5-enolpyruvyl-6-hydroxy-3-cyclohexene-1-carboxylate synthase
MKTSESFSLIDVLARRVRVLTVGQIARTWFSAAADPHQAALKALRRLECAEMVWINTQMVHPELPLAEPLLDWHPDANVEPCFDRLAWLTEKRWQARPERTHVVRATAKARALRGALACGRKALRASDLTHDVHVAAVFLLFAKENPQLAASWSGEDEILAWKRALTSRIPDAVIEQDGEEIAVDFAGRYDARKLRAMHADYRCQRYQLW